MATTITGTNGNDTITLDSNGNLTINSKNGNDTVNITGNGTDSVTVGNGNDTVNITGNGNDTITGGNGNDVVDINGNGNNDIDLGNGNDTIIVIGNGNNDIDAGNGLDTVMIVGSGNNTVDLGNGNDTINITGNGNNWVGLGNGNDNVTISGNGHNVVAAGNGNDTVTIAGNASERSIVTLGNGNNTVHGGAGNDIITTGAGADTIYFSQGTDVIYAGAGTDTFVFSGNRSGYMFTNIGLGIYSARDIATGAISYFSSMEVFKFADVTMDLSHVLASNPGTNAPPTAQNAALSYTENVGNAQDMITIDLKAVMNASDPDGDLLMFSVVDPSHTLVYSLNGSMLTFDLNQFDALNAGQQASFALAVSISDNVNPAIQKTLSLTINGVTDSASASGQTINGSTDPAANTLDNLGYTNVTMKVGVGDTVHMEFHVDNNSANASTIDASALPVGGTLNLAVDNSSFAYANPTNMPLLQELIFDFNPTPGAGPNLNGYAMGVYSVDAVAIEYGLTAPIIGVGIVDSSITGATQTYLVGINTNITYSSTDPIHIIQTAGNLLVGSPLGQILVDQSGGMETMDGTMSTASEIWNISAAGLVNQGLSSFAFGAGAIKQINIDATNLDSATRLALYNDYVAAGHATPHTFNVDGFNFSYTIKSGNAVAVNVTNYDNDGPHLGVSNQVASVNEDAAVSVGSPLVVENLAITDSENDGGVYSLSGPDAGMFTIVNSQLELIGSPNTADDHALQVTVTATDPFGKTASQNITLNVNEVNMMVAQGAIANESDNLSTAPVAIANIAQYFHNNDMDAGANSYSISVKLSDNSIESHPSWIQIDNNGNLVFSALPMDAKHLGVLQVTVTAVDVSEAVSTASQVFNLTVTDDLPPVITAPSNMVVEATGPNGAVVNYSASAMDPVYGAEPVNADFASGSTFALGTTTVNLSATDPANLTGHASFTVTVQDTTAPNLVNQTAAQNGAIGQTVWIADPFADAVTNNPDQLIYNLVNPPAGFSLVQDLVNHSGQIGIQIGAGAVTSSLSITATDAAGNTSAADSFTMNLPAPALFTNNADTVTFDSSGNANGQPLSFYDSGTLYNTGAGNDVVNNLQYMPGLDSHDFQLGDGVDQVNMLGSYNNALSYTLPGPLTVTYETALYNQTIQGIYGGAGSDTINISSDLNDFNNASALYNSNVSLHGGSGDDSFSISVLAGGNVGLGISAYALYNSTATLDGGTGSDALSISADAINGLNGGSTGVGGHYGFGGGAITYALENSTATLDGGAGDDTLSISATVHYLIDMACALDNSTATLDGGAGNDTLSVTVSGGGRGYALSYDSVATLIGGAGDDTLNLGTTDNGVAYNVGTYISTSHFVLVYDMSMDNGHDTVNGFMANNDGYQLSFSNVPGVGDFATLVADTSFTADVNGKLMLNLWSDATHTTSMGTVDFADINYVVNPADPTAQYVISSPDAQVNDVRIGVDHAPVVANPIADQSVFNDGTLNFQVPANTFSDADAGDTLTYSATLANGDPLPSWLAFDPNTQTFSGMDTTAETVGLKVVATDTHGLSVSDSFNLNVLQPIAPSFVSNVDSPSYVVQANPYNASVFYEQGHVMVNILDPGDVTLNLSILNIASSLTVSDNTAVFDVNGMQSSTITVNGSGSFQIDYTADARQATSVDIPLPLGGFQTVNIPAGSSGVAFDVMMTDPTHNLSVTEHLSVGAF